MLSELACPVPTIYCILFVCLFMLLFALNYTSILYGLLFKYILASCQDARVENALADSY